LVDDVSPERVRKCLAVTAAALSVRAFTANAFWVLALALWVAPTSAEIFKCVAKNGGDLYQNFPCLIDSLGSLPSSPPPRDPSPAKAQAALPNVPATDKPANATEPRVGMTQDEVRAIWGEAIEIIQDELKAGRIEIWRYADGRSVQFNVKHRVTAAQP